MRCWWTVLASHHCEQERTGHLVVGASPRQRYRAIATTASAPANNVVKSSMLTANKLSQQHQDAKKKSLDVSYDTAGYIWVRKRKKKRAKRFAKKMIRILDVQMVCSKD